MSGFTCAPISPPSLLPASAAVCLFVLTAASALTPVSGIAIDSTSAPSEEALVDSLANEESVARAAATNQSELANEELPPAAATATAVASAEPNPRPMQYLTNTDYVVPMRSSMKTEQQLSGGEISVYVAIGILTLIALALIVAGSVFCYKYSAALRAADRNDPIGRRPIVTGGSRGSGDSGISGGGGGFVAGDTKLAVHAQKAYYQRQKQNIAGAFKQKRGATKSPIQEEEDDSDEADQNVYGCPGLASTSGLEVNNPIFAGPSSDEE